VVICPLEMARKMSKKHIVRVAGSGQATDTIALHQRKDITHLAAAEAAAAKAYDMAGVKPSEIDLAEVHDCFTIAEICAIEALGLVEEGKGGQATESGETAIGGRIPINTSGGLKSKGHPVGATGVAQICEVTEQLRGESGQRQVKNAKRGLAQNMGGTCASSAVHILEVA
jgi:acetyl-CoA C-acetyltransferase